MANAAALDLGDAAGPQLGGLLSQRRRRAGARAVPGPSGLHPHSVRHRAFAAQRPRRCRSSASRMSTPFPATSPATPLRRASWWCRSFGTAKLIAVLDLDSPTPARFTEEDEAGCVAFVRAARAKLLLAQLLQPLVVERAGDEHHRAGQLARVIPGEVRDEGARIAARRGAEDQRRHLLALADIIRGRPSPARRCGSRSRASRRIRP